MSRKKELAAWIMVAAGLLIVLAFAVKFSIYRFSHEMLTETQLMLWSLARWYEWVPGFVTTGIGFYVLSRK